MNNNILKFGTFMLFFGMLSRKHFELLPIWCEYYEPSELNDIDVPDDWIKSNLFERMRISNDRVYYATSDNVDYSKREFLNVFCELVLNGHQFQGYLYLIKGKVNSLSIFLDDNIVDLYSSELLLEDNAETLNNINKFSGINTDDVSSIKYILKSNVIKSIKPEGTFHFLAR